MSVATRAAACASCDKRISRKSWYYRNGHYFCTKRCWVTAKAKAAEEAEKAKAESAEKEKAANEAAEKAGTEKTIAPPEPEKNATLPETSTPAHAPSALPQDAAAPPASKSASEKPAEKPANGT